MGFTDFELEPSLAKGVKALGFIEPTPVQAQVIPHALKNRDIRACAQTGTGKTCAFAIPLMNKLLKMKRGPRPNVLVLVPTRELGDQVFHVMKDLSKFTHVKSTLIVGGTNINPQFRALKTGVDVIVATPGRLLDHLERRTVSLRHLHTLIFDEADRMLDMGFLPDIRRILSMVPKQKQTMLFSATFPPPIQKLAESLLVQPHLVDLSTSKPAENITQVAYPISRGQKEEFLLELLKETHIRSALLFSRTKHGADHIARFLEKAGKTVGVIHSNFSQSERQSALKGFREKKFQILVATDIASRGIDVKDITHVINYDVPQHPEDYVHRIGRTGRAKAQGDAITLVSPDEEPYISRIERLIGHAIKRNKLDHFPYLVQPRLTPKKKTVSESFGTMRRRIPTSRSGRFRR